MKYYNGDNSLLSWSSNHTNISEKDLFEAITYDKLEMIKSWRIRLLKEKDNGTMYVKMNLTEDNSEIFTEQRHRAFGKCYTLHPPKEVRDVGVYYYTLKV